MFTGIIEAIGSVRRLTRRGDGARAEVAAPTLVESGRLGDSIAVDGVCLTVAGLAGEVCAFDLSAETLARSTLGDLRIGSRVNLERPLRLGDPVGGHLVTGHVDAIGHIVGRTPQGEGALYGVAFPPSLAPLLVEKGSVALDGISLTVTNLAAGRFDVAVIPYTLGGTTLGGKRPGDRVNLEADLIGKYIARLAAVRGHASPAESLTMTALKEHGFA